MSLGVASQKTSLWHRHDLLILVITNSPGRTLESRKELQGEQVNFQAGGTTVFQDTQYPWQLEKLACCLFSVLSGLASLLVGRARMSLIMDRQGRLENFQASHCLPSFNTDSFVIPDRILNALSTTDPPIETELYITRSETIDTGRNKHGLYSYREPLPIEVVHKKHSVRRHIN